MDKNLALQKQETLRVIHGEEQRFLVAVSNAKIHELPEIELRKAIKYAMVKIGLRAANWPEGVEKSLLLQHVYENFGFLTPDEIRMAFDWSIDGRLAIDDLNCFENFSCAYVTKILKAYLVLKNKAIVKDAPQIENKPDIAQIEKEYQEFLQTDLGKQLNPKI